MRVACSVISYTGRPAEPASHHAPTKVAPVPTSTTPPSTSNSSRCMPTAGPSAAAYAAPAATTRPTPMVAANRTASVRRSDRVTPLPDPGLEPEPNAPHSVEQLKLRGLLELAPQIAHMEVDDVALGVEVEIPHLLEQLGAPDHLLRPEQEMLE